ncbi:MAG TPA: TetR/AcrR family transcriptional regulator [Labilithrix sp.]|nr:TetR/AcrR family transcriptional regulator [Labilithrix sp.]
MGSAAETKRRTIGARVGGRSERVVASVLRATLRELARVGYAAMRLEDVASQAGVAKTTIYRRWPRKAELVRDAIRETNRHDDPLPDTGSLRTDILASLESVMAWIATPEGRAVTQMVTMERGDPEVEELCRTLRDESRARRAALVMRAQERGELPAGTDAHLVMDCVFSPVLSRAVRFGEIADRATCERIIDLVVTGAEHGGGQRRAGTRSGGQRRRRPAVARPSRSTSDSEPRASVPRVQK